MPIRLFHAHNRTRRLYDGKGKMSQPMRMEATIIERERIRANLILSFFPSLMRKEKTIDTRTENRTRLKMWL
jgi:hypothetical protein